MTPILTDIDVLRFMRDDGDYYSWLDMDPSSFDVESELYMDYHTAWHAARALEVAVGKIKITAEQKGITLYD